MNHSHLPWVTRSTTWSPRRVINKLSSHTCAAEFTRSPERAQRSVSKWLMTRRPVSIPSGISTPSHNHEATPTDSKLSGHLDVVPSIQHPVNLAPIFLGSISLSSLRQRGTSLLWPPTSSLILSSLSWLAGTRASCDVIESPRIFFLDSPPCIHLRRRACDRQTSE